MSPEDRPETPQGTYRLPEPEVEMVKIHLRATLGTRLLTGDFTVTRVQWEDGREDALAELGRRTDELFGRMQTVRGAR